MRASVRVCVCVFVCNSISLSRRHYCPTMAVDSPGDAGCLLKCVDVLSVQPQKLPVCLQGSDELVAGAGRELPRVNGLQA